MHEERALPKSRSDQGYRSRKLPGEALKSNTAYPPRTQDPLTLPFSALHTRLGLGEHPLLHPTPTRIKTDIFLCFAKTVRMSRDFDPVPL